MPEVRCSNCDMPKTFGCACPGCETNSLRPVKKDPTTNDRRSGPGSMTAVGVVASCTVAWGIGLLALGLGCIGYALAQPYNYHDISPLIWFVSGLVSVPWGSLLLLGGLGLLYRKRWARILTLVVTTLVLLWGLAYVSVGLLSGTLDGIGIGLGLGVPLILYSTYVLAVLVKNRAEFTRPRA